MRSRAPAMSPGKRVAIFGAGPIGLLTMLAASAPGPRETRWSTSRRRRSHSPGSAPTGSSTSPRRGRAEARGGGAPFDVAFEVSGTAAGLASRDRAVRRGGAVVQVGNLPGGQIPVPANAVMAKEIDLRGSFRFGNEFFTAVELIADGSVDVLALVTAQRPLSVAPDAVRLALDRSQSVKVVLTA